MCLLQLYCFSSSLLGQNHCESVLPFLSIYLCSMSLSSSSPLLSQSFYAALGQLVLTLFIAATCCLYLTCLPCSLSVWTLSLRFIRNQVASCISLRSSFWSSCASPFTFFPVCSLLPRLSCIFYVVGVGCVVTLDMALQAHVVIKAFVAMLTLVRSLPCVQTHVGLQVALLVEVTLAHRTFKLSLSRVDK